MISLVLNNQDLFANIYHYGCRTLNTNTQPSYLVGSEPFSSSVFIKRSWPYRAAICKGVFPILSQQSISAPVKINFLVIKIKYHT